MRSLFWFLGAIVLSLLLATALAYPAYEWIHPLQPVWRIDKIATRLFDLILLCTLMIVVRRLPLRGRERWGWTGDRPVHQRHFRIGFALGLLTMLVVSGCMVLTGIRPLVTEVSGTLVAQSLAAGLGSGLVVGLVEETLFRGLIQSSVLYNSRRTGVGLGMVSLLFASLHFLASVHIEHAAVTPHSGMDLLAGTLVEFAHPWRMMDAFLALFGVGLLLGVARQWTGNIFFAAGLHGGWVAIMRLTIGITQLPTESPLGALLSPHDGYTGWLVVAAVVVFGIAGLRWRRSLARWLQLPSV